MNSKFMYQSSLHNDIPFSLGEIYFIAILFTLFATQINPESAPIRFQCIFTHLNTCSKNALWTYYVIPSIHPPSIYPHPCPLEPSNQCEPNEEGRFFKVRGPRSFSLIQKYPRSVWFLLSMFILMLIDLISNFAFLQKKFSSTKSSQVASYRRFNRGGNFCLQDVILEAHVAHQLPAARHLLAISIKCTPEMDVM